MLLACALLLFAAAAFWLARVRALALATTNAQLNSRPVHHALFVALSAVLPSLALLLLWSALEPLALKQMLLAHARAGGFAPAPETQALFLDEVRAHARGQSFGLAPSPALLQSAEFWRSASATSARALSVCAFALALTGAGAALSRIRANFRARQHVEKITRALLAACASVAVLVTFGIVLSLCFEAFQFFLRVAPADFLFGTHWSPQTAIRSDQVGSSGTFGAVPVFAGTLLITVIALLVAAPVGLYAAIYLSEYASARVRAFTKPALEVLAGIPTVVYGFFAALTLAPALRAFGERLGANVASESALAAGLVMGVMIIPFVSSLSDDVINAVPQALREGSLGLGATQSETIRRVVLPAALPGIVGALLLAVSRAIGETMIVVMAAGLAANLTANPLAAVTTVTVQIVTLLTGDQEFDSAKTLAAFALGLVLFLVTLVLNVIALNVVRHYRERYD